MTAHEIWHAQTGSRFSTIAHTTAIFSKPGNFSVICKEQGSEESEQYFLKNMTVSVLPQGIVD